MKKLSKVSSLAGATAHVYASDLLDNPVPEEETIYTIVDCRGNPQYTKAVTANVAGTLKVHLIGDNLVNGDHDYLEYTMEAHEQIPIVCDEIVFTPGDEEALFGEGACILWL